MRNPGKESCVMHPENTSEPPESSGRTKPKKAGSSYTPVKYAAMLLGGLWLYIAALALYDPIGHNAQGEYCDPVEPGEPYHLVHDGYPCRLTSQLFLELGLGLSLTAAFLQIPTLILWATIAHRNWRRKNGQGGAADE